MQTDIPETILDSTPQQVGSLTAMQVRVLGSLLEKAETTPEQYPLTINSLRLACNQKTARFPVVNYSEGEVGHTVRELKSLGFVKEAWGARVAKYEHQAGKVLGLQSKGLAVLSVLMLRGPQTLNEIRVNSQRQHEFDDLDDVAHMLGRLAEHQPPLAMQLPRMPGQKETRYVHLLSDEPDLSKLEFRSSASGGSSDLEARVEALEAGIAALQAEIRTLLERLEPSECG
jgi:uncharacterized protein YceH (UPF0502 family)